jgi:hypothetical protein
MEVTRHNFLDFFKVYYEKRGWKDVKDPYDV